MAGTRRPMILTSPYLTTSQSEERLQADHTPKDPPLTPPLKENIQAAPAAQFQKNKRPNQKMGQGTKQTFLQRRHTDG